MAQLTIIGLGTIGGSLGMALEKVASADKDRWKGVTIAGYDPDRRVVEEALVRGAVDRIARSLQEAAQEADIVIVAQPAGAIIRTLYEIGPLLPEGCIVTDTATSKAEVLRYAAQYLPRGVSFVGGHPIPLPQNEVDWAAGIKAAKPDLLQGAVYCLTPAPSASEQAVDIIANLVRLVGASPFFLDAVEHDGLLAGLSHAPYVVAAAMLYTIASSSAWRDLKLLADPTFQRMNQVLASLPTDFHQACLANRQTLVSWLDRVVGVLQQVRREMVDESSSGEYLQGIADKSREAYQDWLQRRDERDKELAGGMAEVASAKQTFLGLFLPRVGRLRPGKKKD